MDALQAAPDSGKKTRGRRLSAELSDGPTQERAIQTRLELLKSARLIFARDGFEAARLQDIAEAAGRTRGALYAHFKDKEDLFFALIAQDLVQDEDLYKRKLRSNSSRRERIAVLVEHLETFVHDRQRALLQVEFKLYAVRRPHKQRRLAELHAAMCYQASTVKHKFVPELATPNVAESRELMSSFGALLDGLALNLYFDPVGMTGEEVHSKIEHAVRERFQARRRP